LTERMAANSLAKRLMTAVFMPAASDEEAVAFLERVAAYPPIARVFVDQARIGMARRILEPAGISVGTATSYPVGNQCTEAQAFAVRCAISAGAEEIDVGLNYTAIKSGSYSMLETEVRQLLDASGDVIRLVPIPEVAILTRPELRRVLDILLACGVTAVKTSSGYGWNTSRSQVAWMAGEYGADLEIDVSGGVRTYGEVDGMMEAGANFIHTSKVFEILDHAKEAP